MKIAFRLESNHIITLQAVIYKLIDTHRIGLRKQAHTAHANRVSELHL